MVCVFFEDNVWHIGCIDAYSHKNMKVRIVFQEPQIGALAPPFEPLLPSFTFLFLAEAVLNKLREVVSDLRAFTEEQALYMLRWPRFGSD